MRVPLFLVIALLLACQSSSLHSNTNNAAQKKTPVSSAQEKPLSETGCPGIEQFFWAKYRSPEEAGEEGSDEYSGWILPVRADMEGGPWLFQSTETDEAKIVEELSSNRVWFFDDVGKVDCSATLKKRYRHGGEDGPAYQVFGYTMEGCESIKAENRWVVVSETKPTECILETHFEIRSAVLNDKNPDKFPKNLAKWNVGKCPTNIGCRHLFRIREFGSGNKILAREIENLWINIDPEKKECSWEYDNDHVVLHAPSGTLIPIEAHRIGAVAHDDSDELIVIMQAVGQSTIFKVEKNGGVKSDRFYEYYIPHEEDGFSESLAPNCGP